MNGCFAKELNYILILLIVGSLIICLKHEELRNKYIDLAQTGLGGYLALMVQSQRSKDSTNTNNNNKG